MTENTKPNDDGSFVESAISEEDAIASIDDELREVEDGETSEG